MGSQKNLVLSRRKGEYLVFKIGEVEFTVTVVSARTGKTTLAVTALPDVIVKRGEIYKRQITVGDRPVGADHAAAPVA